jgi:signal transduction histidine kinase
MSFDRFWYALRIMGKWVIVIPLLIMLSFAFLAALLTIMQVSHLRISQVLTASLEMVLPLAVGLYIWERFYQVDSAHTHIDNGAALGLALVKEWVEEMSGTVSVESIVGEGSCFTLCLPRSNVSNERTNPQKPDSDDQERGVDSKIHNC